MSSRAGLDAGETSKEFRSSRIDSLDYAISGEYQQWKR